LIIGAKLHFALPYLIFDLSDRNYLQRRNTFDVRKFVSAASILIQQQ